MRMQKIVAVLLGVAMGTATAAWAQDPIVYPAKGQSQDQTEKDKYECYQWAKGQTGFDPMAAPSATAPPPQQEEVTASTGKGLVGGAAAGALIGGIADGNWGQGAAIGAVGGGLIGNHRKRKQEKANAQSQDQWEQQQAQIYQQRRHEYNRAYSACLQGRGYTVT